ncbi:DUF4129 domain-containing protein [Jiangella mangrovi]|uniref:Protein-glutamine gamma-glutamyltransferase-like C-terminal domain-containing protein n=1 Tax=Jiangella mangrovi TaxID=1524084 RepID=A0A7W9LQ89_9ACTN|nr:DUF4129 domain-containing protein [Jiangella mangrovi]MBB5791997.1 hypothetical protein [Jiangella mangrovi]
MHWSGRHRSGGPLAAAVVALAALLVVLALASGPVDVQEPGWLGDGGVTGDVVPLEPGPTASAAPTEEPVLDDGAPGIDVPWQVVVLAAVAAAVYLVYCIVRRVVPDLRLRAARRRTPLGGHVEALPDPVEDLRDGARSAATALSGPAPDAAAAVIAAWLALESAAAGSGAARGPAQTPTEFTAALLRRHHADPDAVATLLGLYHRARFAVRPDLGAQDVEAARHALETLVGTLGSASTVGGAG